MAVEVVRLRAALRAVALAVGGGGLLVAAPLAGYWLASGTSGAQTSSALGAPSSLSSAVTPTSITLTVLAPGGGPVPSGYTVLAAGGSARPCVPVGASSGAPGGARGGAPSGVPSAVPRGAAATCTLTGLRSGTAYALTVRSTLGRVVSAEGTSVRVTTAAAPPPSAPRLAPASESGVSPVDGVTNVTTPTLTGDLLPGLGGAAVAVFDGSTQIAATTAAADGSYVATLAAPLRTGGHSLSARAALNGGARGAESAPSTVVVDTAPPDAPTVASASCGHGAAVLTGGSWTCTAASLGKEGLRFALTASDATSGIASVVYTAATSDVAMPSVVPLPGAGVVLPLSAGVATTPTITDVEAYATVAVAAVDLAGNRSATQIVPAVVDTTAPDPGTAATGCSVALVAGVCPGATTVTVTGIADGEVSSGVAALDWSVAGGPSGVAGVSGGTARFSFAAPDGRPEVTFTTRDVAGNAAVAGRVTPTVPLDSSGPVATSVVLTDGGSPGSVGAGDSLAVTLADGVSGIDPNSLYSGWTGGATHAVVSSDGAVVVTVTDAGADDVLTVGVAGATTNLGSFALGGNYVVGAALVFSGAGDGASSLQWVGGDRNTEGTLTISLGALVSGAPRVVAVPGAAVWTPGAVADLAGHSIRGSAVAGRGRL